MTLWLFICDSQVIREARAIHVFSFVSSSSEREGKKIRLTIYSYISAIFPTFGTKFYKANSNLSFGMTIPYLEKNTVQKKLHFTFCFGGNDKCFPSGASGKEPAYQCRRQKGPGFDP